MSVKQNGPQSPSYDTMWYRIYYIVSKKSVAKGTTKQKSKIDGEVPVTWNL